MKKMTKKLEEVVEEIKGLRTDLLVQLQELQADFEDLSDEDLVNCRGDMLTRINQCLEGLEESEEDNIL